MEKQSQPNRKDRKEKRSNQEDIGGQNMPEIQEGHPEQQAGGPDHHGGDAHEDRNP